MRGGSAPSWRQGQGWCPAEKAETAARCGFMVSVLEGARRVVIAKCKFRCPSSSRAPGAQPVEKRGSLPLAAARALRSTRMGSINRSHEIRPTGPVRSQHRRKRC